MVVAGTKDAVLMVESEASELSEDVMLAAVMFAHEKFQVVIDSVAEFAKEVGILPRVWEAPAENESLMSSIKSKFESKISEAYQTVDKMERYEKMGEVKDAALEEFIT
jgi:Polyribonucleotide nucleotidyltransferase (polynucleotide phosphorylase)